MTSTQVALLQLDNYGPWTVTPEPRREMHLQALQSRLFATVAEFVGSRGGYVFPTRYDNMVAVTNGLSSEELSTMQELVADRFPVTMSVSVATDTSPGAALSRATTALQEQGSAQSAERSAVLCEEEKESPAGTPSDVQIAHFDVVSATERYTDRLNAFDSYVAVDRTYRTLRSFLHDRHDALSFFVGGDNVVAVCPGLSEATFEAAIDHVRETVAVELRVGVGSGETARAAGSTAKEALEACRHRGTAVERGGNKAGPTAESVARR